MGVRQAWRYGNFISAQEQEIRQQLVAKNRLSRTRQVCSRLSRPVFYEGFLRRSHRAALRTEAIAGYIRRYAA
jgi:hypothetical protein